MKNWLTITFTDGYAVAVIICVTFMSSISAYYILLKLLEISKESK